MASDQTTRIPHVPIRSPMFDEQGNLTRTWIIFFEQLGQPAEASEGGSGELKATFCLNRTLTVADDLTNHFICRNPDTTPAPFASVSVKCKAPPTGSAARLEIEISKDEGATWYTIFSGSGYIELADGDATRQDFTGCFRTDEYGSIVKGDLLRINCTQIGSTIAGAAIEVVAEWEPA